MDPSESGLAKGGRDVRRSGIATAKGYGLETTGIIEALDTLHLKYCITVYST